MLIRYFSELSLPSRGGLSLRRSDERLRAELPALACARDRRDLRHGRPGQGCGLYSVAFVVVNAEQAEDWNGASGREFIEQRERHEQMLGRLRARLLAAARIRDGENILDIGCGCGDVTIPAARATRGGHALGADFSRIQVAEARRLAAGRWRRQRQVRGRRCPGAPVRGRGLRPGAQQPGGDVLR